jgi:hypothetical protein
MRNVQVLPDGRIMFHAGNYYPYVWGFQDGSPFDVTAFKSTFDSRGLSVGASISGLIGGSDGKRYYMVWNSGLIDMYVLGSAYDLAYQSSRANVLGGNSIVNVAFSADGTKFFHKAGNDQTDPHLLYVRHLSTAWDLTTAGDADSLSLRTLVDNEVAGTWRGFSFSPDGSVLLVIRQPSSTDCRIIKAMLSTPFDVSTASVSSTSGNMYNETDGHVNCVAVNGSGSRMLAYYAASRKFLQYDLTA